MRHVLATGIVILVLFGPCAISGKSLPQDKPLTLEGDLSSLSISTPTKTLDLPLSRRDTVVILSAEDEEDQGSQVNSGDVSGDGSRVKRNKSRIRYHTKLIIRNYGIIDK